MIVQESIDAKPPMGQAENFRANAGPEFEPQPCDDPGHKGCGRCCNCPVCPGLREFAARGWQ